MSKQEHIKITFFFEISPPFIWSVGKYKSKYMTRFWAGFISFGWMWLRIDEALTEKWNWEEGSV